MTEFTKTKIHFTLALLGTLFVVHPFLERYGDAGFTYLGYRLELFAAFALTAGLLALAVYCYAIEMLSERPSSLVEKVGNYSYAFGVLIFPLYGGLYLARLLEEWLERSRLLAEWLQPSQLAWVGPGAALALGIFWLGFSQVIAWRMRRSLGEQDRSAKVEQLAEQEIAALNRARELFASNHYDLSVIQAWKAIELRLRRVLLGRGVLRAGASPQTMIDAARKSSVLDSRHLELLEELRRQWNIAVSVEPLTREATDKALSAARDILATISISGPEHGAKPPMAV
jgi:HEPN domain-containing protein